MCVGLLLVLLFMFALPFNLGDTQGTDADVCLFVCVTTVHSLFTLYIGIACISCRPETCKLFNYLPSCAPIAPCFVCNADFSKHYYFS